MMFNLTINNYRSFQKQKFNFSRVNILIGENSGGKSSLLKMLLALKQTIDSPTEVNLKLSGDLTDLGNFEEVVYYRKKNRKISISFESGNKYFEYFQNYLPILMTLGNSKKQAYVKKLIKSYKDFNTNISFEFSSNLDDHSTIKTIIKNENIGRLEIIQKKNREEGSIRQLYCDLKFNFKQANGTIENCSSSKEGFFTLFDPDFKDKCMTFYEEKFDYIYYSIAFLLVYQNYIESQIERIQFVNPIVTSPKRFYFQEDKKSSYKQIDLEKFVNVLNDKKLSAKNYQERIDLLNETIRHFGIADEVEVIKNKQLPVFALNVKTIDFWSNITDVGYGVSLQIPILFQAILSENYTKNGQTILIEQPEVHLHPSLQAKFIETLLSIGSKNSYFIETHSEHIIRKLQVLIKNKEFGLKPEDITIHYFKREPLKFAVSEHQIQSDGKLIPPFPSGFFDTSYLLVKQLL